MSHIPKYLLRHRVTIEAYTGDGPDGPTFADPVDNVACFLEPKRRLVLAKDGTQVVSNTTLFCRRTVTIPAESKVTLPDGTITFVLSTADHDGGDLPTPDHIEAALQ